MIELDNDRMVFSFPEVHKEAKLTITFQRTLRIPDDGRVYPLPPGFGPFPLRHIDDYEDRVPDSWLQRAGVLMPMYQREALWIYFSANYAPGRTGAYPFAVKIYTGKINAITGREFRNGLNDKKQDFLVIPGQPWLDGYCVEEGLIRQFVAMPLGQGYTAEEQITGEAEWGGMQIIVYPMEASEYERRFPIIRRERGFFEASSVKACMAPGAAMGLAPGGKMKQEIYQDPFGLDVWDQSSRSRCFVHMLNSQLWKSVTGEAPPKSPIDAKSYNNAGFPWFDYYDEDLCALKGSKILHGLKSVDELHKSKKLAEEWDFDKESQPKRVIKLGPKDKRRVDEGAFWEDSV